MRIAKTMGLSDDVERFGNDAHLLGGIDKCKCQIPRAMKDAKGQCADHDYITGSNMSLLPENKGPAEHCPRHYRKAEVVQDPGFLQINPAAALGASFDGYLSFQ